jgi:hypothetical protein
MALGDKILQVMWTGVKYCVTGEFDVIGAYYHYIQNPYFGTPMAPLPALAASIRNAPGLSTQSLSRSIGALPQSGTFTRGNVLASEWRIGLRLSPAQQHRSHGRLALPFLKAFS